MNSQRSREGGIDQLLPQNMPTARTASIVASVVLGVVLAWSSVFTVAAEEVGVVLTFGKYSRQAEPGLRVKWPWPVQTVMKVPVQRQLKAEFGFRTASAGVQTQYTQGRFTDESLMLTGDLNVAVVEWTTQFRVNDPYKYLFKVRGLYDPREERGSDTFRAMNEAVMRAVIGDRSVNEVLTIGRQEIASEVERRLQALCDQYETGIRVEQIVLQDVNPPDQVRGAFNEVNQAQQEKERMINEARSEYNAVIPRARGEAQQTITQAEGYATDRVNRSRGDAALFNSLLAAYRRAPEVTRRRIYLETMQAVYPNVQQKIVLDEALKGILPLLGVVVLLGLLAVGGAFYIVGETQQVVIFQFGEPRGESVTTAGLKFKLPFIRKARYFDNRFLEWDGDPNEVPTRDKRFIHVDTYARWRITDPLKYYQRLRSEQGAQSRLDDILDGETRNVIANHDLIEVVRSSNRQFAVSEEITGDSVSVVAGGEIIEQGRGQLAQEVLQAAQARTEDLGIEILDFRFKRINYVEEVRLEVYARMISERNRIAEQFRSEGGGEAARISGERERDLRVITSEAYRQAQEIQGRADAEAADIYAAAYNGDPEFYRFLKSMEVLRQTMDSSTVLVLSTDNEFLRYLRRSR